MAPGLLGVRDVIVLGDEAGMRQAVRHGVLPGDRARGAVARAAAELIAVLGLGAGTDGGRRGEGKRGRHSVAAEELFVDGPAARPGLFADDVYEGIAPEPEGPRIRRVERAKRPSALRIGHWDETW
jgi:hypothetical protein